MVKQGGAPGHGAESPWPQSPQISQVDKVGGAVLLAPALLRARAPEYGQRFANHKGGTGLGRWPTEREAEMKHGEAGRVQPQRTGHCHFGLLLQQVTRANVHQ